MIIENRLAVEDPHVLDAAELVRVHQFHQGHAVMSPQMNLRQVVLITWLWARVTATVEEIHEIT
jgi:hypothetical protein